LRQALELATNANDDALVAEMLAAMSHQSAFYRNADDAIDMALAARRAAVRSGVPTLHAEAAALEAHGLALHGDARGCIAALQRAEKAFGASTRDNTPPWLQYFDEAYLSAKFGHALRDLGRASDAERFARGSLQMTDGYDRGRLFNTALLSSVLIAQGRVDEGIEHALIAIRMATHVRSARVHGYLRDIATRLTQYSTHTRVPAVQQELRTIGV
jgi:ATP/maltotriose-dependent transcriptional regulator MalT